VIPDDTQKLPKVGAGWQRPNPSPEWRTSILRQVLKHLTGVVHPGLETYHWITSLIQCSEELNSAKTKPFWGKILPHFEGKQWTADCWPWNAPIVSKSTAIVWHFAEPCKAI
jgi:hypothetical protein